MSASDGAAAGVRPASQQPPWTAPPPAPAAADPPLRLYNSLTRSKTLFTPIDGRRVLWYMCGPTVYDAAHMGHARTYVCFDVARRVLRDVFGYDVLLCMNITDVDDKIIMRSAAAGVPFDALAREHEASFLADMRRLGVAPPDVLTRVSEYVPEIVAFVERLIARSFAYASNGSVYFDTAAFAAAPGRHYAKLVPENAGDRAALEEGEGALPPASAGAGDKRGGADFALWKASKAGEPSWPSPWGAGRPGWHIECSAMADAALGPFARGRIDIHSGGVDLRFPHHDNELAQSEACLDADAAEGGAGPQWVNYFVHSGHLNIEGLKMSKSLKNFIKIGDALEAYGARQLRLAFLLTKYNAPMSYSEAAMAEMAGVERSYAEFFATVKAALRALPPAGPQKWGPREAALAAALAGAKAAVRAALADDLDTPAAMAALAELVRATNRYLAPPAAAAPGDAPPGRPVSLLIRAAAQYVTAVFRAFGLVDADPAIGFSVDGVGGGEGGAAGEPRGGEGGAGGASREATLAPVLDALAAFRESVREAAAAGDTARVLAACDALRDDALPPLGVRLEDASLAAAAGGGLGARWKLRDAGEAVREVAERRAEAARKAAEKEARAAEASRKAAEKEARAAVPPGELFRADAAYAGHALDADGVPVADAAGAELSKSKVKALRKEWAAQAKAHDEWRARRGLAPLAGPAAGGAGAAVGAAGAGAAGAAAADT